MHHFLEAGRFLPEEKGWSVQTRADFNTRCKKSFYDLDVDRFIIVLCPRVEKDAAQQNGKALV